MTDSESAAAQATRILREREHLLRCRRCQRPLLDSGAVVQGLAVEIHQDRRVIRCPCGYRTHVARMPHAPEPRQRPHMSKKERRRARARLAADAATASQKIAEEDTRAHKP